MHKKKIHIIRSFQPHWGGGHSGINQFFNSNRGEKINNVVFYGFQFAHHGKHTAYLALKEELEKNRIKVVTATRPEIFFKRGFRRLRLLRTWMKIQEYKLYRYSKLGSNNVIHYFFPENSLFFAPRWKGSNKLIMTCHQPVKNGHFERLEKINPYFVNGVKNADVIILMASNDIQTYQQYAPQAEVIYIPLGVDVNYFSRDKVTQKKSGCRQILTVGNWLRDYGFWVAVVKELLCGQNKLKFTVIAIKKVQEEIRKRFNYSVPKEVELLSGISDEELRNIYASSDLMFLPLIDAWANDALLEAASMGITVMATDLPAIREYLTDELGIFFNNESASDTAGLIEEILEDRNNLVRRGRALRDHVEKSYSWEIIAERYMGLYKRLSKKK